MSSTAPESGGDRSFALTNLFRRFLEYRERRFQRDVQRRAEWIAEARNAPTVQDWIDSLNR